MVRLRSLAAAAFMVAALSASARADDKGTVLLTGFEPFQGPRNPSWEAVKAYDGTVVNGYRIRAVELAVEWERAPRQLEAAIRDNRPVAVISFGEGLPGEFSLEEVAHNRVNPNLTDNVNAHFTEPHIRADGPAELRSTLPLAEIEAAIRPLLPQNLEVAHSQDPGSYLCEYVFYLDRYFMQKYGLDGPAGFIHVPYGAGKTDFAIEGRIVGATTQALTQVLDARLASLPLPPPKPVTPPTTTTEPTPPPTTTTEPTTPPVTEPTPVTQPPQPAPLPVLRRGDSGADVAKLQKALRDAGFPQAGKDGKFGPRVEASVKAFQKKHGLGADGVVGARTWAALGVGAPSVTSGFLGGLGDR